MTQIARMIFGYEEVVKTSQHWFISGAVPNVKDVNRSLLFSDAVKNPIGTADNLAHAEVAGAFVHGANPWKGAKNIHMLDNFLSHAASLLRIILGDIGYHRFQVLQGAWSPDYLVVHWCTNSRTRS